MKILLIDADSTIPNLALMKISAFYKSNFWGCIVDLTRLFIPYYPDRKKIVHNINTSCYDLIFCSVIFEGSANYVKGENIQFGGSGFDLTTKLPEEIENSEPDYSIYNETKTSYGFISRGCIRKCSFCKVHLMEGFVRQVSTVKQISKHKTVKFLDNNFLALPNHCDILQELIELNVKHQFNQGLDIRLVTEENSILLSKLNYWKEYIFAFDNLDQQTIIEKQLSLLTWRKDWQFKFFVYVKPDMKLNETIKRIEFLKERKLLPYIMRDISCWKSENREFYIDIAAWCNQVFAFKSLSFEQFLKRRHTNKDRIQTSLHKWNSNK